MVDVSILITAYNEEEYIKRSVSSALKQEHEKFEVIVINDGSKDKTEELLEKFDDSRLKIFNQKNKGRIKSLNRGVRISNGNFIAILDADDVAFKSRIKKQSELLRENEEVGVVGSSYIRNDEIRKERYIRKYPSEDDDIRKEMAKYIPISHSSAMLRKKAILESGGYMENEYGLEDMDLWLRIGKEWGLANIEEPLVARNIRGDSYWHRTVKSYSRNIQLAKLNAKAVRVFSLPLYYYIFPLARLMYSWLPTPTKRVARRLISRIIESDISPDLQDENSTK